MFPSWVAGEVQARSFRQGEAFAEGASSRLLELMGAASTNARTRPGLFVFVRPFLKDARCRARALPRFATGRFRLWWVAEVRRGGDGERTAQRAKRTGTAGERK